uniref:IS91 family transposase n=1 Tax=Zooshikella harenae TaxID=2827238 RepID=UPI0028157278|nr:IS91 family transposase [Zooshikella harenae]
MFRCSNSQCSHTKRVCFSCKGRFCPTCGKKLTEQWIQKQKAILPKTAWQHITFTMPGELWELFNLNRFLLNDLSRLAANTLLKIAKSKGIIPGIFTALHTFGRDLKWNTHIHLSTTQGGLTLDYSSWKSLYFKADPIKKMWRYAIIRLLRKHYHQLVFPESLQAMGASYTNFNRWLNSHYQKTWNVHFAKPNQSHKKNVSYLGRYTKRPPLAMSRLEHYDGHKVIFNYLDHKTKTYRRFTCSADEFMHRFTQHIPDKGFRMIRYYGFLANRVRGKLLPKVYNLLDQAEKNAIPLRWPELHKQTFGSNPMECILCRSKLILAERHAGLSQKALHQYHRQLALQKPIYLPSQDQAA